MEHVEISWIKPHGEGHFFSFGPPNEMERVSRADSRVHSARRQGED